MSAFRAEFDTSFLVDFDPDEAIRNSLATMTATTTATTSAKITITATITTTTTTPTRPTKRSATKFSAAKRRKTACSMSTDSHSASAERLRYGSSPEEELKETLLDYFGYSDFRGGQLEVIQAVLRGRDAAVFWATGSGKSLCYQIPPLYLGKVAVIVSPLISLMQDQVHKLNGLSDEPLAVFLGSAQFDEDAEPEALRGDYPLVYVTPEKLTNPDFLFQLKRRLASQICLFAIDEAHCVSEWGNDFRKDYRELGRCLRDDSVLNAIPVITLTATATERVHQDILVSLRLRNAFQVKQSFDRTNLKIRVTKKKAGMPATMLDVLGSLGDLTGSTIVYAPTRKSVDEITFFLQKNAPPGLLIEPYHAGLSPDERKTTHTGFLTGRIQVIVATVAFGMGIDKPDIRRVVHFGPPKTVEEYYQQIGRAGRDGRMAECIMTYSTADFNQYDNDYYLGGLPAEARKATEQSMARLREFALDSTACRRKSLLQYFNQVPPFGEWCGTCDVCQARLTYQGDSHRDFGTLGARVVLYAVSALEEASMTNILKVISGSPLKLDRQNGPNPTTMQAEVRKLKDMMPKQASSKYFEELLVPLVQSGFLLESKKSGTFGGFSRSWTVYRLSSTGQRALMDLSLPIVLPVSEFVRSAEKQEEERRQRVLAELESNGLKSEKIPISELQEGDGVVIRAYSKWYSYLEGMRRSGKEERLASLEALLSTLEQWRLDTAVKYSMAPATVLAEHLLVSIAYITATLPAGVKLDKQSITTAGVRTREVDSLVATLGDWVDKSLPAGTKMQNANADQIMILGETRAKGCKKWQHAVYKPAKKTGMAVWEVSYVRFDKGESLQTIAMTPASGRPIQVNTVVGHILEAVVHGRNVDLNRLVLFMRPPTKREWEQLRAAELSTGMNVCEDPAKSGRHGEAFKMTDFLRPIVGDVIADKSFQERSEAEKALLSEWYNRLSWYLALRRAGYEPTFFELRT